MAKQDWLGYASDKNKKKIEARQMGGEAPAPGGAPQGGAPQGGGQGPNPQELLMAFGQAMQAQDEGAATQIALQFTSMVYDQMAQEQQAGQGAMAARNGGNVPSFNAEGKIG